MAEHPARLLANFVKHYFQRRRQIAGRRNLHRDRLEQTKLFLALFVVLFDGGTIHYWLPSYEKVSNSTGTRDQFRFPIKALISRIQFYP